MESKPENFAIALTLCLSLIILNGGQAQTTCNSAAVDECLNIFKNVSSPFQSYNVNGSDFDPSCKAFNDAVTCINTKSGCKDGDRYIIINWLGTKNWFTYVCKDGKNDYLAKQACLSNATYIQQINKCSNFTNGEPVKNNYTNMDADQACRQYTEALQCRQAVAQSVCQAGDFMRRVTSLQYDPQTKAVAPTCTGLCNGTALDACVSIFRPWGSQILPANLSAAQLDEACNKYPEANNCVKNTQCSDQDTIMQARWLGSRALAEYTCGEGKTAYLNNLNCLSNATYLAERNKCPFAENSTNLDYACQTSLNRLTCFKNVTQALCGKDALKYISNAFPLFLGPLFGAGNPNCKLPIGTGSDGTSIVASTLVLMMSLVTAALI